MNLLLVLKPLFDSEMNVQGYYFSYQYGNAILEGVKSNPLDGAMHSPFLEFINEVGLEAISQNLMVFVPVTRILMMTDLARECNVEREKIVLMLEKNVELDALLLDRVIHYNELGFKIAIRVPENTEPLKSFLPFTDYVLADLPPALQRDAAKSFRKEYAGKKLIISDISHKLVFDEIKHSGADLFDGPFYKVHMPTSTVQNALSPLKVNYIQLLNIVNQDDFDFQAFTRVVRQDTALAIQFMQLVNATSRTRAPIKDINQAAALLGQKEIKKWISTAVSNALCSDRPSEITRVSMLRAKFCENLAKFYEMATQQDNLFMVGLLSVLDVILEMPMEDALKMIFIPDAIRDALSSSKGDMYRVLEFVLQYEHGDWLEISRQALVMNMAIKDIHNAYVDAMMWYTNLINTQIAEDVVA